MNVFNGFLVTMGSLAGIAGGVLILLVVTETVSPQVFPSDILRQQFASMAAHTGAALWRDVGIAAALIAAGLFVLFLEARQLTRSATPHMILLSSDAEGVVRLSLDSVSELAKRTGSGNHDVRNIRCRVRVTDRGLSIRCMITLRMGADVPEVSSDVQKNIREVVERLTSLTVSDVPVRVRYQADRDQAPLVR